MFYAGILCFVIGFIIGFVVEEKRWQKAEQLKKLNKMSD